VAGDLSVTIDHGGGLRSTYSILSQIYVTHAAGVEQGQWIGRAGTDHRSGAGGLHFGVKLDGVYVDPMEYLGPVDLSASVHLAPVLDDPGSMQPTAAECVEPRPIAAKPPPPNDNVAVLVAGLSSATRGGGNSDLFNLGRGLLGYRPGDTYRFSYAGHGGRGRHRPYRATDTYGDILLAARRLRDLLAAIARRRPGADVDLIAHSQGGVVARLFLQRLAHPWVSDLPRVEHLVTLATPHSTGAPDNVLSRTSRSEPAIGAPGASWAGSRARVAGRSNNSYPDRASCGAWRVRTSSTGRGLWR
jgi:pimeloyl-ACP methyl ester carboxylesterase